jgi:hypothetical protein
VAHSCALIVTGCVLTLNTTQRWISCLVDELLPCKAAPCRAWGDESQSNCSSTHLFYFQILKLKLIYDRQPVGLSVLVSGAHLGPATNFSFSLKFPSDSCGFISLWRPFWREDWSVILLLGLARAVTLGIKSPPTWRARSPYLFPPGTGWPSYTPGHWVFIY